MNPQNVRRKYPLSYCYMPNQPIHSSFDDIALEYTLDAYLTSDIDVEPEDLLQSSTTPVM
jgi:hypothetical protein